MVDASRRVGGHSHASRVMLLDVPTPAQRRFELLSSELRDKYVETTPRAGPSSSLAQGSPTLWTWMLTC